MDCFNTNKFAHFINLLRDQGFFVDIKRKKTHNSLALKSKEVKIFKQKQLLELFEEQMERIEEFKKDNYSKIPGDLKAEIFEDEQTLKDWVVENNIQDYPEDYANQQNDLNILKEILSKYGTGDKGDAWLSVNKDILIDESEYPKYIQNNIKLLNIQPDCVGDYEKILIDNHKISNHFRICKFFFKDTGDTLKKLEDKKDYNCKKGASCDFKILFLQKVLKELGVDIAGDNPYTLDVGTVSTAKSDKLLDEYRIVFTDRNKKKKISFEDEKSSQQLIVKMYKNIFGADIIISKKSTITTDKGVKSITRYNLNVDKITMSKSIYSESNKTFLDNGIITKQKLYSKIQY
tara:strand:- start:68 stop:1108 length:1041 start_codon:yes stop_codon:yes gene_type:complete